MGFGSVGRTLHAPLISATPGIELCAVVSSDSSKVHADLPGIRVFSELAPALSEPDIDLVVIATPDPMHAPQAHQVLDAGKHVVVEKPMALTLEEARTVADHARAAGRDLFVFHNRRWDSDFLTLRALIETGKLGEIVQFESHIDRFCPVVNDCWRDRAGAGTFYDLGPHLIDQVLVLFGMPEAVFADLAVQRAGGQVSDYFHLLLRYPERRVILHSSQLTVDHGLRLAIHGSRGSFVKRGMDIQAHQLKAGQLPRSIGFGVDPLPGSLIMHADGMARSQPTEMIPGDYTKFYDGVRNTIALGMPNPVPVDDALCVMEIMEAAKLSAREQREIAMRR